MVYRGGGKLTSQEREALRWIEADARRGVSFATLIEPVRGLLALPAACFYTMRGTRATGLELDEACAAGMTGRFTPDLATWIVEPPRSDGLFADRPEESERNRVVSSQQISHVGVWREFSKAIPVFREQGLHTSDQLRIVLCDGPWRMAWLGGYQSEPFTAKQRWLLGRIGAAAQPALRLKRQLQCRSLAEALMPVTLEAIARPAWVLDGAGRIVQANAGGHAELAVDRDLGVELRRVARLGEGAGYRLFPVPFAGASQHTLIVRAAVPDARAAAKYWGLTPRQTQMLSLVLEGRTNQSSAMALGISERAVEMLVSKLLARADVPSRSALAARAAQLSAC